MPRPGRAAGARKAARAARSAARRLRPGDEPVASEPQPAGPVEPAEPDAPPGPVVGVVEHFSRRLVSGWLAVPPDAPPVQVSLHLGDLRVASTYATASPYMSGSQSALRGGGDPVGDDGDDASDDDAGRAAPAVGAPLVHDWQRPNLPGPPEDRRNSDGQVRVFAFKVRGIWPFVKRRTPITVRVGDRPLPIVGHGTYLTPPRNGKRSLRELRELMDRGHLLTQFGTVELAKSLDEEWQRAVMSLYGDARAFLAERFGYDAFLIGGTLLGAVREGGYIGHDVDFDAAYVSRHTTGPETARELVEIGLAFVDAGWAVECMRSNLHLMRPDDLGVRVDLFHTYFDEDGLFAFPWGIAGTSTVRREDWRGTREIDFPGGRALVPANDEQMVEHLYGADWRLPKPGFNWLIDRTAYAAEGILTEEQRSVVWWADHHARTPPGPASPFVDWLAASQPPGLPDGPVVDLGCGSGADACALAGAGRAVLGVDRSAPGVRAARSLAARSGVAARFEEADLADAGRLGPLLDEARGTGALTVVLRQVLCSVPAEVEDALVALLAGHLRPGDAVAVEVRGPAAVSGRVRPVPLVRPRTAEDVAASLGRAGLTVTPTGSGVPPESGDPADSGPPTDPPTGLPLHRVLLRHP